MAFSVEAISRIARNYAADVSRELPVDKAVLFGSYAKGYATDLSDVDICFFLKDYNGKGRVEIITELLGLGGKYRDVAFEPIVFKTAEIQNDNPFVREILATGVELL
ncbi:MAG: nucleotidyltransferase domain-containing protein [Treponema sp.]|jgi:predicted nucleotidyltransferase|nr:nucleotidyltransferase domain-containing protein [Treponema sp.]